jgi:hypothetical protein
MLTRAQSKKKPPTSGRLFSASLDPSDPILLRIHHLRTEASSESQILHQGLAARPARRVGGLHASVEGELLLLADEEAGAESRWNRPRRRRNPE